MVSLLKDNPWDQTAASASSLGIADSVGKPAPPIVNYGTIHYATRRMSVYKRKSAESAVVRSLTPNDVVILAAGADRSTWGLILGSSATDTVGYAKAADLSLFPVAPPGPLEIEDWNWYRDPDFGTKGATIWTAIVRNNTNEYVERARVEFTSFDGADHVVDTDYSYATGLAPGGTASVKSYATYFGTEKRGSVRVVPR